MKTLAERLAWARNEKGITQQELSKQTGSSQSAIGSLESGARLSSRNIAVIANVLNVDALWLQTGKGSPQKKKLPDFGLQSAEHNDAEVGEIEYWDVKGSCGGGFLNFEQMPKGHLVKEAKFFRKFGLNPEDAFAIYADGDSMAEFIVDGDIVIFDKTKTTPISGRIFAIDHPDGLRIKVLRRMIDGSWVLESKNADKGRYPDEIIPPGHAELLKIHGQFVYRQGG